jgi:hypothetical protein
MGSLLVFIFLWLDHSAAIPAGTIDNPAKLSKSGERKKEKIGRLQGGLIRRRLTIRPGLDTIET